MQEEYVCRNGCSQELSTGSRSGRKGKVLDNSRVDNNLTKVNEFFDSLHPSNNTKVVMESSGMWYNIYECLSKRHLDVRLSNPTKTRAIASAKIKTDKLDAVKLADLLRGGYIAECYIPTRRDDGTTRVSKT